MFTNANKKNRAETLESGERAPNSTARTVKKTQPQGGPSLRSALGAVRLPVYDQGGEVDVKDGDHELAVLQNGERVLTPEQAAQYDQDHNLVATNAQPSAFGSAQPVPEKSQSQQLVPISDEPRIKATPMPGVQTIPSTSTEDQLVPRDMSQQPSAGIPRVGEVDTKAEAGDAFQKALQAHTDLVAQNDQKRAKSATKGDLVGLGAAIIADKTLDELVPTSKPTMPVYGGQLAKNAPPVGAGELVPQSSETSKDVIADYKKKIQAALDKASPEGEAEAGRLKQAMLNYQENNPWGSAGNHPGVLGKVAHVLGTVGNVAGMAMAPEVEAAIPGSLANRMVEGTGARALVEQGERGVMDEADARQKDAASKAALFGLKSGDWSLERSDQGDLVRVNKVNGQVIPVTSSTSNPFGSAAPISEPTMTFGRNPEKQPVGAEGVAQQNSELKTLTSGMTPEQQSQFLSAYGVKPTDSQETQEKRLEAAKASAQLSSAERDRALQRAIAEKNHEDNVAARNAAFGDKTVVALNADGHKQYMSEAEAKEGDLKVLVHGVQPNSAIKAYNDYKLETRVLENTRQLAEAQVGLSEADQSKANRITTQFVSNIPATGITGEYIEAMLNPNDIKDLSPNGQRYLQMLQQHWSDLFNLMRAETGSSPRAAKMFDQEKAALVNPQKSEAMNALALQNFANRVVSDSNDGILPAGEKALQGFKVADLAPSKSDLKEGVVRTAKDGSKWTLIKNRVVRVD